MATLNKNQLTQLGDSYLLMAQAVGNYRIVHYKDLTVKMKKRIREYHKNLIDYADAYYAASTNFIIEDAEASLEKIAKVSNGIDKAIAKVKKVQIVINTIGASVRLGAAIISRQPQAISASLKDVMKAFKKLNEAEE